MKEVRREAIRATVTEDHRAREATRATATEDRRVKEVTRAIETEDPKEAAIRATVMEDPREAAIRATVTVTVRTAAVQDHRDNVRAEMLLQRQVPLILQSRQSLPATGPQRTLIKMTDLIREIKMTRLRKGHRVRVESR